MLNQLHGIDLQCSPSQLIPGVKGASLVNQGTSLFLTLFFRGAAL